MPIPIVMQLMAKVTGKVKLTAARACVPSNEIKKVSTRLNIKIATIPNMVGMVMVRNVLSIGAVNSPCLSCMQNADRNQKRRINRCEREGKKSRCGM